MLNVYLCLKTAKILPFVKSLSNTKSLAFAKFLVIDKYLIDEKLTNMTEMLSSNNFWSIKINHFQVLSNLFKDKMKSKLVSEI